MTPPGPPIMQSPISNADLSEGSDSPYLTSAAPNRIAVSADGRDVLIVRDHHAYDVEDGFVELNCPPEPDKGYSTQVINIFTWRTMARRE